MDFPKLTRNQRVVLEHTTGPFRGLFQITGHSDAFEGQSPPSITGEFEITPGKRKGVAGLVRVTPRYVLYREISNETNLGTFDRRQQ